MNLFAKERLENTEVKKKAEAWSARLDEAVTRFLDSKEPNRNDLIEILWRYGILERISPSQSEEKEARKALNKAVFDGDRSDPELYWRILYSAGAADEAVKRGYSVAASGKGLITGALTKIGALIYSPKNEALFPETFQRPPKNPYEIVIEEIIKRAKLELKNLNIKPHDPLIPWDSTGKWQGMELTVDRYTDDGFICFRAKTPQDHARLYELSDNNFGKISPSKINPEDFNPKEK